MAKRAKLTFALLFTLLSVDFASAQGPNGSGSSARQALAALRTKPDCDAVVAEFQALNSRVGQEVVPKMR